MPRNLETVHPAPLPDLNKDKETYEQFKKMLIAARVTANRAQRVKLYEQVQDLMAKSVVVLPLWQNNLSSVAVAKKNVKGIVLDASMLLRDWLIYKHGEPLQPQRKEFDRLSREAEKVRNAWYYGKAIDSICMPDRSADCRQGKMRIFS